jgi:type II restriction enzyme
MPAGSFAFHLNVPGTLENGNTVNITVDAAIKPHNSAPDVLPILIEAKSAGDFTNTNKRRKEEATKIAQLRRCHGREVVFVLFLCGYFDGSYLGYEAAEGIDWVWEHRIDDMAELGL